MEKAKDKRFTVRIPADWVGRVEKFRARDGRTLQSWVQRAIWEKIVRTVESGQ